MWLTCFSIFLVAAVCLCISTYTVIVVLSVCYRSWVSLALSSPDNYSHCQYFTSHFFSFSFSPPSSPLSSPLPQYYQLPQITIGSFNHQLDDNGDIVPITATLRQYKVAELSPSTDTFVFDRSITTGINCRLTYSMSVNALKLFFTCRHFQSYTWWSWGHY